MRLNPPLSLINATKAETLTSPPEKGVFHARDTITSGPKAPPLKGVLVQFLNGSLMECLSMTTKKGRKSCPFSICGTDQYAPSRSRTTFTVRTRITTSSQMLQLRT